MSHLDRVAGGMSWPPRGAAGAGAAPADLDTSFGGDGIVEVEGPAGLNFPREAGARMVIGPNDEIYVLYSTYPACEPPFDYKVELTVARYTANGATPPTARPGPQLTVVRRFDHSFDLAVGADGEPVVAATTNVGGVVVARIDLGGRLDGTSGSAVRAPQPLDTLGDTPAARSPFSRTARSSSPLKAGGTAKPGPELLLGRYLTAANGPRLRDRRRSDDDAARSRPTELLLGPTGGITIAAPSAARAAAAPRPRRGQRRPPPPQRAARPGLAARAPCWRPPPALSAASRRRRWPDGNLLSPSKKSWSNRGQRRQLVRFLPDGGIDTSSRGGQAPPLAGSGRGPPRPRRRPATAASSASDGKGHASVSRLRPEGGTDRTFNGGQWRSIPGAAQVALQSSGRIVVLAKPAAAAPAGFAVALRGGTDRTKCLGKRATIVGTANQDEIVGTPRRDVIAALGGKDKVRALAGADLLCGGKGRDTLLGGPVDQVQHDPARRRSR